MEHMRFAWLIALNSRALKSQLKTMMMMMMIQRRIILVACVLRTNEPNHFLKHKTKTLNKKFA